MDPSAATPVQVGTRKEFEAALPGLFGGGAVEAPSLEALEAWGVDIEDEEGAIPADER